MVYESRLLNLVKHYLISSFQEHGLEAMCINKFLPRCAALLYPYKDEEIKKNDSKTDSILPIINAIKSFAKGKKKLSDYSLEALYCYFQSEWLPNLEFYQQVKLVRGISLITDVEEDGYFSIKGNEKVHIFYLTQAELPDISNNYGKEDYNVRVDETPNTTVEQSDEKPTLLDSTKENIKNKFYTLITEEEKNFLYIWQREKLPDSLKQGEFFWQYKITNAQYETIKNSLISLHFENKNAKFIRKYAFYISFFLAEWFKREYDGYQNERGLSILGIDSQQSRRIWEGAKLSDSYLINSGQNEWLFSIYVLGGFPINYIRRVKRFDSLFKKIWSIKQGEDIDDELLEEISDSFDSNNTVYQESMRKGGSLYAYIESLINDEVPLAEEDKDNDPYRTYCEMLSEGKRACYDSYLSSIWNIYTDGQSEGIDAFINVKIGTIKNRCYIPYDCVMLWTGDSMPNEFILGLETESGKKSDDTIRFSKSGKNFVGWGDTTILSMMFDVQEDHRINVMMYSVSDEERMNGKVIQHPFDFPDSCQFYQTSIPYKWSSSKDVKAYSAVFFNTHRYQITEGKENSHYILPVRDNKPSWVWTRIYDAVTLVDVNTSEEISYNIKQGSMNVFFSMHRGIRYNQYGEVIHIFTQEDGTMQSESVPLILGINGIKSVKLYPFEANEAPRKVTDYKVSYKQDSWNYKPFDKQNEPKCGMLQLKINHENSKPIIKRCFYVPYQELLKRKIESKQIQFLSSGISIWKPVGDDYELMNDNEQFDCSTFNYNEDVISFHVGGETDFIILDVYRADKCSEIYFENRCISRKKESIIDIPLILKQKFHIRTIDENGVKRIEPGRNVMIGCNVESNIGELANRTLKDAERGIRYYLYTTKYDNANGRHVLKISPKQKDNYQFYFWSCKANDEPIMIQTTYDEELKSMVVPQDSLEKQSKGIIFQSLKEKTPPNYVLPYYSRNAIRMFFNLVHSCDIYEKAMKIAVEHHVYFSQFYQIHKLFKLYDNGQELVKIVVDYLRKNNKKEDFIAMHRMANEFLFEWIALPWLNWKKACETESDKKLVERLFRSNPRIISPTEKASLDIILENYWALPRPNRWDFRRNNSIENIVLQSIRGRDKDYTFFLKRANNGTLTPPEENCNVLKKIYENDNFYRNLQKEINEKIINR